MGIIDVCRLTEASSTLDLGEQASQDATLTGGGGELL
jgi:hypothetical protein